MMMILTEDPAEILMTNEREMEMETMLRNYQFGLHEIEIAEEEVWDLSAFQIQTKSDCLRHLHQRQNLCGMNAKNVDQKVSMGVQEIPDQKVENVHRLESGARTAYL